ncbi:hypothetical protein GCM10010885_16590 [Alicyclobacillus cellulosilyticus]|uniref:DhaL domain-containing protein n=1 Tax=Alicyclobacillus cellulosilyticus TaxID=1003997 RepID=A0A917KBK2_9BACL|nr:DAK2 domain-containing protein [Alicyclobacillus cellulosilyticus]GGJ08121.1 hypothetical protein GCM10010885_16590 [Alicyclobacillus cellulosilyticus]
MANRLVRLDGDRFVAMIKAGHERLRQHVSLVNALNIFPVPDGDTGTNMEMSLAAGVEKLAAQAHWTLAAAAHTLAAGLLMGARGNSGVILSQLFRGFLQLPEETAGVQECAKALAEGVHIAYRAVAKPVEGTMLTVAREGAAAGVKAARQAETLADWMRSVVAAAREALARTPEQLPVLKQAGVVDSGGQGLLFIFEGFLSFLEGKTSADTAPAAAPGSDVHWTDFAAAHVPEEAEYGFCTEVLIRTPQASAAEAALRRSLSGYGTSLLVVAADDLVKVHVHTMEPLRALQDAAGLGELVKIKVENMTLQHQTIRQQARPEATEPQAGGAPAPAVASCSAGADRASAQRVPQSQLPSQTRETAGATRTAVVAVAAGDGLREVFTSLGAAVVLSGGQTMNPSTEEIVAAVSSIDGAAAIVLPNNKNIIMAAEQARQVVGQRAFVVPTISIPQGIAAMLAFLPDLPPHDLAAKMWAAAERVRAGHVVRAVRDSVYQDVAIRANQFLGLIDQTLVEVAEHRNDAALAVLTRMGAADAELLTMFYGRDVPKEEAERLAVLCRERFGVEVELQAGGQPVYDYIMSLE